MNKFFVALLCLITSFFISLCNTTDINGNFKYNGSKYIRCPLDDVFVEVMDPDVKNQLGD